MAFLLLLKMPFTHLEWAAGEFAANCHVCISGTNILSGCPNRVLSMQMPLRSGNRLSFVSLLEKSKGRMDRIAREIKPHRKSDLLLFLKSTFKDFGFLQE